MQVLVGSPSTGRVLSAGPSTYGIVHLAGNDRNVIMGCVTVYFEDFASVFMRDSGL